MVTQLCGRTLLIYYLVFIISCATRSPHLIFYKNMTTDKYLNTKVKMYVVMNISGSILRHGKRSANFLCSVISLPHVFMNRNYHKAYKTNPGSPLVLKMNLFKSLVSITSIIQPPDVLTSLSNPSKQNVTKNIVPYQSRESHWSIKKIVKK